MKRFLASLAACLAALAGTAAQATPSEIDAVYRITTQGVLIGNVRESFRRTGDTYAIRSTTQSEGVLKIFFDDSIELSSSGRVNAAGLQPLEFGQRRMKDSSRDLKATFDWAKGVMRSVSDGQSREVPLPSATQDRISVMYQFMNLHEREPLVAMHMANGRKVELYTYRFVDEVRLATPAGEFDTVHYERVIEAPDENRAQLWLARDRFNFPVRVVFDDPRGLRLDQMIVELTVR